MGSRIFDLIVRHFHELKPLDFAVIVLILGLGFFALWRLFDALFAKALAAKDETITSVERLASSYRSERDELERRAAELTQLEKQARVTAEEVRAAHATLLSNHERLGLAFSNLWTSFAAALLLCYRMGQLLAVGEMFEKNRHTLIGYRALWKQRGGLPHATPPDDLEQHTTKLRTRLTEMYEVVHGALPVPALSPDSVFEMPFAVDPTVDALPVVALTRDLQSTTLPIVEVLIEVSGEQRDVDGGSEPGAP